MDSEVWKHLADHEEILRLVLDRLSWETNRHLRSVSKAWNATLSEPSFLTWASMLTDRRFYTDHGKLKWRDSSATTSAKPDSPQPAEHSNRSRAEPVCLLSTSEEACAVANFDLLRWFKFPPLQHLPFGRWDDFTVSGAAEGLLLLEGKTRDRTHDLYNLERYLFNPLTSDYVTLPPVPRTERSLQREFSSLRHPMILSVDKFVKVVATEFSHGGGAGLTSTKLNRILIWRQNSLGWESFETDAIRVNPIRTVEHAVFAAGELFLHTRYLEFGTQGHRVITCSRQPGANFEVNMAFLDRYYLGIPILHLFQHRGVLMCVIGTWKTEHNVFEPRRLIQYIKLCKFDHARGEWLHESMIDMPEWMVMKLYDTLYDGGVWRFYFHVEGDTLCIGNRRRAQVFFLCNLVTDEWCASTAREFEGQNESNQEVFLWSPRKDNGLLMQI